MPGESSYDRAAKTMGIVPGSPQDAVLRRALGVGEAPKPHVPLAQAIAGGAPELAPAVQQGLDQVKGARESQAGRHLAVAADTAVQSVAPYRKALETMPLPAGAKKRALDMTDPVPAPPKAPQAAPMTAEGATYADGPSAAPRPPQGGAGGVMVPGGRRTQGWQVQEGLNVDEDTRRAYDAADGYRLTGLQQDAAAGQEAAEREVAFSEGFEKRLQQHEAERAHRVQERNMLMDTELKKLDESRRAVPDTTADVVGKGVAKLFSIVGVAAGAWAGSMNRTGRNAALETMNAFAQQEAAEQQKKADKENNYFARMKQLFGDEDRAAEATHIGILEAGRARMATLSAATKNAYAKAQLDKNMAGLAEAIAQRRERFGVLTQDKVQRTDANIPDRYVGFGTGAAKPADVEKVGEAMSKAGIPETEQTLGELQARIDAYTKDGKPMEGVAGTSALGGKWETMKPDALLSPQGLANRQMVGRFNSAYRKMMTGAGGSDAEAEKYEKDIRGARTVPELQRSIQAYQNAAVAKVRNIEATYDPKAVAEYNRRMGPGGHVKFSDKGVTPTIKPAGER